MIITVHHILQGQAIDPWIGDFFEQIKPVHNVQGVDLVILMDRSEFTQYSFYLRSRQIISAILKYHILIGHKHVHISVVTFADNATTIIDGIANNILTKCELFEGPKLWDNVIYDDKVPRSSGANVSAAMWKAYSIFTANNTSRRKIILIITDGVYNNEMDRSNAKNALVNTLNTDIFAIGSGPYADQYFAQIRALASKDGYYSTFKQWNDLQKSTSTIAGMRF